MKIYRSLKAFPAASSLYLARSSISCCNQDCCWSFSSGHNRQRRSFSSRIVRLIHFQSKQKMEFSAGTWDWESWNQTWKWKRGWSEWSMVNLSLQIAFPNYIHNGFRWRSQIKQRKCSSYGWREYIDGEITVDYTA